MLGSSSSSCCSCSNNNCCCYARGCLLGDAVVLHSVHACMHCSLSSSCLSTVPQPQLQPQPQLLPLPLLLLLLRRRLPPRRSLSVWERGPDQVQLGTPRPPAAGSFSRGHPPGRSEPQDSGPLLKVQRLLLECGVVAGHHLQVRGLSKEALRQAAGLEPLHGRWVVPESVGPAVPVRVADSQVEHGKDVVSPGCLFQVPDGPHHVGGGSGRRCRLGLCRLGGLLHDPVVESFQVEGRQSVVAVRFVRRYNRRFEELPGPFPIVGKVRGEPFEVRVGQFDRGLCVTGVGGQPIPLQDFFHLALAGGPHVHAGRISGFGTLVVPFVSVVFAGIRIAEPHDPAPSLRGAAVVPRVKDLDAVVKIPLVRHGVSPIQLQKVLFAVLGRHVQSSRVLGSVIRQAHHHRHKGVSIVVRRVGLSLPGPVPADQRITRRAVPVGPSALFGPEPFLQKRHQRGFQVRIGQGPELFPKVTAANQVFAGVRLARQALSQRVVVQKDLLGGHAVDRIRLVVEIDRRLAAGGVGVLVPPQHSEHLGDDLPGEKVRHYYQFRLEPGIALLLEGSGNDRHREVLGDGDVLGRTELVEEVGRRKIGWGQAFVAVEIATASRRFRGAFPRAVVGIGTKTLRSSNSSRREIHQEQY
mmetsp:Transcript_22016/g.61253  ORF Transcript_22016/g.61253 Transcript_22016/m.61253 type:complete len:637 (-) Transcript_22016:158-2068(-)